MECSLYGTISDESVFTQLQERLDSMCMISTEIFCNQKVYQTSTGTRASSMARLIADKSTGSTLLKLETAADITQNSESSINVIWEVPVINGNPETFLESMGYKQNHYHELQGQLYEQFSTSADLSISTIRFTNHSSPDLIASESTDRIVKLSASIKENSEISMAEAELKRFAAYLAEYMLFDFGHTKFPHSLVVLEKISQKSFGF